MIQGSAFAEYVDFKSVDAFLKADPPPSYNGEPLVIMTKYLFFIIPRPTILIRCFNREAYCEMKIKEKGLTGKAASQRRENILNRKGFNAFRDAIPKGKSTLGSGSSEPKEKPEIWLEFMGSKVRVHEEDGGNVNREDVPHVKGATMKFSGCGGDVNFISIKVSLNVITCRIID